MKILAIETSTMLGGIAVVDGQSGLVAETRLNVRTTHSERLMTALDHTLVQSGLVISDIDAFAVAVGPGSFTGLRIGLSTVKGLSYATGKPVVTVPTLEAFAWNFAYCRYPVCLMLDARRNEVYSAVFSWDDGEFKRLLKDSSIRPADLLAGIQGTVLFAGEGSLLYKDAILGAMGERALFASPEKMVPSPANVAVLGLAKAVKGDYADIANAAPAYIRKSEAELKWKG